MKYRAFNDPETGWAFNCQVQDADPNRVVEGGLVLNNVTHQGHRFADEIRVIGFWLEWETKSLGSSIGETIAHSRVLENQFFYLGTDDFEIDAIEVIDTSSPKNSKIILEWEELKNSRSMLGFGHYPFYLGLRVKYKSKANIFATIQNFDKSGLEIWQTYLFSKYSNFPAHEPSGTSTAARIHPLVTINWINNPQFAEAAVVSNHLFAIRFDYVFHVNLDRHHVLMENSKLLALGNQAGIFKDGESPDFLGIANPYQDNVRVAHGITFSAAEKPLLLEICAKGLVDGFPSVKYLGKPTPTWDNIHMWGARGGGEFPSTPGAFHAFHLHWRWGLGVKGAEFGNEPQFIDGGYKDIYEKNNLNLVGELNGVALVDPECWIQTIEFAITLNSNGEFNGEYIPKEKLKTISTEQFYKHFFIIGGKEPKLLSPDPNEKGSDLIFWMSIRIIKKRLTMKAFKDNNGKVLTSLSYQDSSMNGSIFIHGIFFPHEAEPTFFTVGVPRVGLGSRGPIYFPRRRQEIMGDDPRKWERY